MKKIVDMIIYYNSLEELETIGVLGVGGQGCYNNNNNDYYYYY